MLTQYFFHVANQNVQNYKFLIFLTLSQELLLWHVVGQCQSKKALFDVSLPKLLLLSYLFHCLSNRYYLYTNLLTNHQVLILHLLFQSINNINNKIKESFLWVSKFLPYFPPQFHSNDNTVCFQAHGLPNKFSYIHNGNLMLLCRCNS